MDTIITKEMISAGQQMADDLITANIGHCMNGLGGSKTIEEFINTEVNNKDLCLDYINNKIVSVEAIYIAMERAKKWEHA